MFCDCVAGGGFGSAPFGSAPFGSGLFDGPVVCAAYATATNAVTVDMDGPAVGPALDPRMWRITPTDGTSRARLIQTVGATSVGATVYTDGPLTARGTYLLKLLDEGAATTDCDSASVTGRVLGAGAVAIDAPQSPARLAGIVDLANPSLQSDASAMGLAALGSLQIDASGDLASDYGIHSLRKRIIRRVTTTPGSFFHLPGYGAAPTIKGLLTPDKAKRLELRFRAQVIQEPDVADAIVRVALSDVATNVLSVFVRATLRDGSTVDVSTNV